MIEPSKSAYCSPVVMVTKFDAEPMGNPDDIMAKLSGNKFFAKIDLSKGYWQIHMEEDFKEFTAFGMPDGC